MARSNRRSTVGPTSSPWRVVLQQAGVGAVAAAIAWWITRDAQVALSVVYGALVVIIPALLFARGMSGRLAAISAMTAVSAFFVWEAVKICISIAMLIVAPQVVQGLSWPAALTALMLTSQVYWLALLPSRSILPHHST